MKKIKLYIMVFIAFISMPQYVWGQEVSESVVESEIVNESSLVSSGENQSDIEKESESILPDKEDESETRLPDSMTNETENINESIYSMNLLSIDDEGIYDGMDQAYRDGYIPRIIDNKVSIILPLVTQDNINIDSITVAPDIGSGDNLPFIIKNYQKTFYMTHEKRINNNETVDVFLVEFEFELSLERINGVYPILFNIDYIYNNILMSQNYTVYVYINDSKVQMKSEENMPVSNVAESEAPTSEPKIIISKCTDFPEKIVSGDLFSFNVVLKNTNKLKYVQNMTVTVSSDNTMLSLVSDSNVFYFDYLGADDTLEIPLSFSCENEIPEGKYIINLDMSYDNPDAMSMSSSGKIEISISQNVDVELEIGTFSDAVNAGDTILIPIQVINLGRGEIYNARCYLEVPGLELDTSLFLGNLEGGSAISSELQAFAGFVNPDVDSEQERYGRTSGIIALVYEDGNGQEYKESVDLAININALQINPVVSEENEDTDINFQLIIGVAILIILIIVGTIIPILIYRKRIRGKL